METYSRLRYCAVWTTHGRSDTKVNWDVLQTNKSPLDTTSGQEKLCVDDELLNRQNISSSIF
jgi:hypothetical protein